MFEMSWTVSLAMSLQQSRGWRVLRVVALHGADKPSTCPADLQLASDPGWLVLLR